MPEASEPIPKNNREATAAPAKITGQVWSRLIELWIFMAIAIFFALRVLGSRVAQSFIKGIGRHHLL
jgi:hypothetical protein